MTMDPRLLGILREFSDGAVTDVAASTESLRDALGLDSMLLVELQLRIEDEFGVVFDPTVHDLAQIFQDVDSLNAFVQAHVEGRNGEFGG